MPFKESLQLFGFAVSRQCGRSHFSNGWDAQMEQLHTNKETAASSVGQENKWFCATHLILEQMAYLSLCLFFLI